MHIKKSIILACFNIEALAVSRTLTRHVDLQRCINS